MRLILLFFTLANFFSNCQESSSDVSRTDVILQFIDEELTKSKADQRMLIPPLPPESNDSTWYSGKMRPDSVVRNLKPLTFYINDSIKFNTGFKPKKKLPKGFDFLEAVITSSKSPLALDISSLQKQKGIIFKSIRQREFDETLRALSYQNDFGGLISFENLFFSSDGKKAYFEIHLFKGKLNAGSNAIYATWKNGKWSYMEKLLSIS